MSSSLSPRGANKGFRNTLRRPFEKTKKFLKPPLKSTCQLPLWSPAPGANSPPPIPRTDSISSTDSSSYVSGASHFSTPGCATPLDVPADTITSDSSVPALVDNLTDHPARTSKSVIHDSEAGKNTWGRSWMRLETTLKGLKRAAEVFPPLESAIGSLVSCLDVVQAATKNHQDYKNLASDLEALAKLIQRHLRESGSTGTSDCVANIVLSLEKEVRYVKSKKGEGVTRRIDKASEDSEDLAQCSRRIEALFRLLQADATLSTWAVTQEHLANTRLEAMSPAKAANYDSAVPSNVVRSECIENTRQEVLSGMDSWSNDPAGAKVYWLNGMAGTGKTTIACSLSAALADRKQLGASFFCTRVLEECRDVMRVIPTLAYQLARYSHSFQYALCKALHNDPDLAKRKISIQFKRLLKEPLLEVQAAMPNNVVVVIDALDECNDDEGVRALLDTLFQHVSDLPLKFFVASRPEPKILDEMLSRGEDARSVLHLHEIERSSVQADIRHYLHKELAFMSPINDDLERLVKLSDNLFIYSATAVRYIKFKKGSTDPRERLLRVLAPKSTSNKMYAELDALYTTILEGALVDDGLEQTEADRVRLALWTAVCVQEPVTIKTLAALTGIDEENAKRVLQSLLSVLHISEANGLVSPLHASFPDFIFTPDRSKKFFCDRITYAPLLAHQCFSVMKAELKFNICKLESSFMTDEQVEDLQKRVERKISQPLFYACRYWADHLSIAPPMDSLFIALEEFLSWRLLFWMEVMNVTKINSQGISILQTIEPWLTRCAPDQSRLVHDARTFMTTFSANPLSLSTPHIYISALPFCHQSMPLLARYWERMRKLIRVKGTAVEMGAASLAKWNPGHVIKSIALSPDGSLIAFGGEDREAIDYIGSGRIGILNRYNGRFVAGPFQADTSVNSVGFSPDNRHIVSGADDSTICLWNAWVGIQVVGPFKGHTYSISSVAFSPDGTRIVSGSADGTICVWNAQGGKRINGPFGGNKSWVRSVAFSPDGTRIASGGFDKTICVWNAHDGKLVAAPFRGHTDRVNSIAFSPDGLRIASGSSDTTICVWNAQDGKPIISPFKAHAHPVSSVAFSPDGAQIVSACCGGTIYVWNAQNGELAAGPFREHTDQVNSVVFSPDSTRIFSGSSDKTIRMWDTQVGKLGPLKGHNKSVKSVAFSSDGTRIVSGSDDMTICVWSRKSGKLIAGPFKGHSNSVNSVAFSPDGKCIASGSVDKTIRLWNSLDGKLVTHPLKGHTDEVNSVGFSPDGTRIVSGSRDCTICVWEVQGGQLIVGPIKSHISVNSVVFSPDSLSIASGAPDGTICVWNAHYGGLVMGPFKAHTWSVRSVAFSLDGMHIVSGSLGGTICVWDARDGKPVTGRFKGNTHSVNSVAFSPDGMRIASGSSDNTISVWNAQDGKLMAGPFKGHTGSVNSVAFSPDGLCVVSCSDDCSVRITSVQEAIVPVPALNGEWDITASGWVLNQAGQRLFWVPHHLHSSFPRLYESCVIGPPGSLQIGYHDVSLGDTWCECYIGE